MCVCVCVYDFMSIRFSDTTDHGSRFDRQNPLGVLYESL